MLNTALNQPKNILLLQNFFQQWSCVCKASKQYSSCKCKQEAGTDASKGAGNGAPEIRGRKQ